MQAVNDDLIRELCPELRSILDRELAAGNEVIETSKGWPGEKSIFVMLGLPFRAKHVPLPENVVYRELNDRHWWKAEFLHEKTLHVLACCFSP